MRKNTATHAHGTRNRRAVYRTREAVLAEHARRIEQIERTLEKSKPSPSASRVHLIRERGFSRRRCAEKWGDVPSPKIFFGDACLGLTPVARQCYRSNMTKKKGSDLEDILSPEELKQAEEKVERGEYATVREFIKDAVHVAFLLDKLDAVQTHELRKKIADGVASLVRGEGLPGEQVMEELRAKNRARRRTHD